MCHPWRTGTADCPANNFVFTAPTRVGLVGGNPPIEGEALENGQPAREAPRRRPNGVYVLRETSLAAMILSVGVL